MTLVPAGRTMAELASTRNKFGARIVEVDGYRFASKAEARRYEELRLLNETDEIKEFIVHPSYALYAPVLPADIAPEEWGATLRLCPGEWGPSCIAKRIGRYTADFAYYAADGTPVVEDVKGGKATRTEAYRLRVKIFEANYGVKVTEVEA